MKALLLLFASSGLLLGQSSVVTCFEGGEQVLPDEELTIGIVPIEDYHKVQHELSAMKKELDTALRERAVAVKAFEQEKGRSDDTGLGLSVADAQTVAALQEEMRAARADWKEAMKREREAFGTREKDLLGKIDALEKERAEVTAGLEKQLSDLQMEFGKSREEWEKKLVEVENARDEAVRKLEESELTRVRDNKAWEKSVADWKVKVEEAIRSAQIREAQATVDTTAKLAAEWKEKRQGLEGEVAALKNEMAELEGRLGVKGFEQDQAGILRDSLQSKSQALEEMGARAEQLAAVWREERESSARELQAMKDLSEARIGELAASQEEMKALRSKLDHKNGELERLAGEASKLAETWKTERGNFETEVADLQKKLNECEAELNKAGNKLDAANKVEEALRQESLALMASQKDWQKEKSGLGEQAAMVKDLNEQLGLSAKREEEAKGRLGSMEEELKKMKEQLAGCEAQRDESHQKLGGLEGELAKAKDRYAAVEKDLAEAQQGRDAAMTESGNLRAMTQQLEQALAKAQSDIKQARDQAEAARREPSPEQTNRISEMEGQLGRLAKSQQELQGTLSATLNDFEGLQKSYLDLRAKAADGGEVAREAEAKARAAEEELGKLRQRLKEQEAELKQARDKVKAVEEKKDAAEAEAAAGKEALGKRESELQEVRRDLGKLQLGHEILVKEAKALRERFVTIEPVRYQLASANVIAQQERVLAEARQVLEIYPQARFSIRGHTCNLGTAEGNLRLSQERADTLKNFLIENGIPADRIAESTGAGDTEPEASNETDEGRRQNRRVEIEVVE